MLSLLLDENLSPEVATQLTQKRPDISVTSVHFWQEGRFKAKPDSHILTAAASEGLTLVTYDQRTILPLLVRWGQSGTDHGGVVFVDQLTIAPHDFGTLLRSLTALWDSRHAENWTNVVTFLRAELLKRNEDQ